MTEELNPEPTQYRSVGDGYCRWLEYKFIIKILWINIPIWRRVKGDHWDEWMHEGISCMDHYRYVQSYDHNLEDFVKKYPNIDDWMKVRNATVLEKMNRIEARKRERETKNSGVIKH